MSIPAPLRWLAPCLLAVGLAACSSSPPRANGQSSAFQPASPSDVLTQTSWDLERWTRPDGSLRAVPHPSSGALPATVNFVQVQGAPRIAGFGGCNPYSATYTLANGQLIVRDRPVSTMKACAPETTQLEQDFLAGMTRITASSLDYANNPQHMIWMLETGDRLDFGRRADPVAGGQAGATKLVYVNDQRVFCGDSAEQAQCYEVRDSDTVGWQLWRGEITGFHFQPGVRYRLRVVEAIDPNPPPGAGPVRWDLDAIVEQEITQR